MPRQVALSGQLVFPATRATSLESLRVDAARFDDWPEPAALFGAGPSHQLRTVAELCRLVAREPLAEVAWTADALRVRAILAVDSELWSAGGLGLMALFRLAGSVGAAGGLGITGWGDGDRNAVVSISTKADGASKLSIMTGKHADNAAKALHAHVASLGKPNAQPPESAPPRLPLAPDALKAHHAVVAALRALDPMPLFEITRALDLPEGADTYPFGADPHRREPLTARFKDAASLLDGLERGWPALDAADALRVAARAREILARLGSIGSS